MAQRDIPMTMLRRRADTPHMERWAPFRLPGKRAGDLTLISVYGYPNEGPYGRNKELIGEIADYVGSLQGANWVVGGEWNITPIPMG